MGLDKAVLHGREKRKPYRGAKAIARSCRNHGACEWCRGNRLHKFRDKRPPMPEEQPWGRPWVQMEEEDI